MLSSLLEEASKEEASKEEEELIGNNYFREGNPSMKFKILGYMGAGIGLVASAEFFLLGVEFSDEIVEAKLARVIFGILFGTLSFIPNASLNTQINKEIGEDISTIKDTRYVLNKLFFIKISAKTMVLFHSSVASFAATSLLLGSIENWPIATKYILGIPSFLSNVSIFYYSTSEFFITNYFVISTYFRDRNLFNLRKKSIDACQRIKNILYIYDQDKFESIKTDADEITLTHIYNQLNKKPNPKNWLINFLQVMGIVVGIGSVFSYKNVGEDSVTSFCRLIEGCTNLNLNPFNISFGIVTFSAYLFFAMDQTAEGLVYAYWKLRNMLNDRDTITRFCFSFFLSIASSIPNGYIAMKYFSDFNIFLKILLVGAAFFTPVFINLKWMDSLVNKVVFSSVFPKCQEKHGDKVLFFQTRERLITTVDKIQKDVPFMSSKKLNTLFFNQGSDSNIREQVKDDKYLEVQEKTTTEVCAVV